MRDFADNYSFMKWLKSLRDHKRTKADELNLALIGIAWMVLGYFKGHTYFADAYFLLFEVDKSFIHNEALLYTGQDIFRMQEGLWCIVLMLIGLGFFVWGALCYYKLRSDEL